MNVNGSGTTYHVPTIRIIQMAELYADDDVEFPRDFPLSYAEIQQWQKVDPDIQELIKISDESNLTEFRFGDSAFKIVTNADKKIILPVSFLTT